MTPTTVTRTVLTMALTLAIALGAATIGHADEQTSPADAAVAAPVAPAADAAKAIEPAGGCMPGGGCIPGGGCMPGGGCCGACQQAPATAATLGDNAATGGCPCQKTRQKPAP